ncbi:DUF6461 domain-containing protein [Streptomyces subrutilus]|uniref:DUF6461 domain-containing protein n=1 Tax=Streptomyces subrutilus TaxID=36818 RepID=UPI00343A0ECC
MYGADLPLVSVTFARDLTPRQLLERMGADPATLAERTREDFDEDFNGILYEDDAYVVTAGRYGSWAWVWEHGSWLCVEDDDLLGELSAETAALSLHVNEKPLVDFRYAENGQLMTGLHPPGHRATAPHRPGPSPLRLRTPGAWSPTGHRRDRTVGNARALLPSHRRTWCGPGPGRSPCRDSPQRPASAPSGPVA